MAGDLNVDIVVHSHKLAGSSVAVGGSSFFTGPLAECLGRCGLLVGALAVMAAMMAGSAAAWAYWQVLLAALVGGLASGIYMRTIYGEVGDRVADSQRRRAMGWLIGGQDDIRREQRQPQDIVGVGPIHLLRPREVADRCVVPVLQHSPPPERPRQGHEPRWIGGRPRVALCATSPGPSTSPAQTCLCHRPR